MSSIAIGLTIPEEMAAGEAVELAAGTESAGLDSVWFTEVERDALTRCAATIARTERLRVGTGVAQWTRSPVAAATAAAELAELSGGRFAFGLGTGSAYVSENFHGIAFERPARRMSEYLQIVRGAWAAHDGTTLDFAGEHFAVRGFSQPHFDDGPPLILAAVGEGMLRLAARHADGVMFNPSTNPWYARTHAQPHLEKGFRRAGRSADGFERIACVRCAIDADRETARAWGRRGIAQYAQYPVHQRQYEAHGFGAEAERINEALVAGDTAAAVAAVSEEMVDALALTGTPDEVRRGLAQWEDLADTVSLLPPSFDLGPEELRANCEAIVATFAS